MLPMSWQERSNEIGEKMNKTLKEKIARIVLDSDSRDETINRLLALFETEIEKIKKWAKQHNNDADLVATSGLMRFLDSLEGGKESK